MKNISIEDLKPLIGKVTIIDIRTPSDYSKGHIPTATNVPKEKIYSILEKLVNEKQTCYIVCNSGVKSIPITKFLQKSGIDAVNVLGGTRAYAKKYPLK